MSNSKRTNSKRKEVIVQSMEDLIAITKQIDPLKPPPRTNFSLQLPFLSEEQRIHYELKLSKSFSSCGCDSGAALGIFSLVAYILIIGFSTTSFSWTHVLFGVIVFAVASLTGKLTGLTRANYKVKKIIKALSYMENGSYSLNN